jgi:hypothetical protein
MTQDEIIKMAWDSGAYTHRITMWGFSLENLVIFADAIAAKAIAELESQEPRNVRERWNVEFDGNDLLVCFNDHEKGDKCQYGRYSPQRTWVGLTVEEIAACCRESTTTQLSFYNAIEAKLKEKNSA